jgi:putative lipoprotein
MKNWSFVFAVLVIGLAAGCKQDTVDVAASDEELTIPTAAVTGTVTYRERMALSPDAVVEVNLQDISRADAEAILLARQEISNPGQVPVKFVLEYDPAGIDERMTYAVSARITDRGELMFVSDTIAPVLTRGAGNEVDLVLVRANSETPSSVQPAELVGTSWKLIELGGDDVAPAGGVRMVHIIMAPDDSSVKGFAGCNTFFGQFETMDDALAFSAMGSTMMACPNGMDTEQRFFTALGATTRYRINGTILELYADDQLLARLEAVDL